MTLRLESDKASYAHADGSDSHSCLRLDSIFQDNMVFQRNVSTTVSGYGPAFGRLRLSLGSKTVYALSARDGRFTFRLPPMAAAENLDLVLTDEKSSQELRLKNVAVGDVYIIAGQSNMSFALKDAVPGPDTLCEADYQGIRYFKIQTSSFYGTQTCFNGKWEIATRENAGDFSAVGFFFASKLARLQAIPVGIVDSSLGGLNIESWISRGTLLTLPHYRDDLLEYEKTCSSEKACANPEDSTGLPSFAQKFDAGLNALFPTMPEDTGFLQGYASPDFDDSHWETMRIPDTWTQAGHNHAGYFWFRYEIDLPADAAEREWTLNLGMVDKADHSYFNGKLVGATGSPNDMTYWDARRSYRIPAGLARAGRNVIAVQVASVVSICEDGGLQGPAEAMSLSSGDDAFSLCGLWRMKETVDAGTENMTFMMKLGYGAPQSFSMFYDNMIKPLSGFQFSGAIWYQGEANAICKASVYKEALVAMIQDWRRAFENADMPFYIIQLPDYYNPHVFSPFSQWALLREAQAEAAAETRSKLVVTLGSGDVVDIHPKNKKAVGDLIAEMESCRQKDLPCPEGPIFSGCTVQGQALLATFKTSAPLASAVKGLPVGGFAIAGADGVAYPAVCTVDGPATLRLSSPEVPAPVMLWYAWGDNPMPYATLCDAAGRPASPFRWHVSGNPHDAVSANLIHTL